MNSSKLEMRKAQNCKRFGKKRRYFWRLYHCMPRAVEKLIEKKEFKKNDVIVMLFPDHGSRYLSKIYNDKWLNEQI